MPYVFAGIFAIIGAFGGITTFLIAGVVGYLFGRVLELSRQLKEIEAQLDQIPTTAETIETTRRPVTHKRAADSSEKTVPTPVSYSPVPAERPSTSARNVSESATADVLSTVQPGASAGVTSPQSFSQQTAPLPSYVAGPDIFDRLFARVKGFFTDGNLLAKVGIILLFIAVAFLVKLAAEKNYFPLEARFITAGAIGIGLLILGWRLRVQKTIYALILQGGAVGILYITIFAAAKLYQLLPLQMALVVMIAIVILSAILAVLQDAKYLAVFGAAGGFLAPVLTSTGGGNHVMLFGYYALLNFGIVGIAWFRSWRGLNLLGFIFTFVIGLMWGAKYYRAELFNSTEPFLVLFFLMFVLIPVLFSTRQPPKFKGYVDSTLVFGVPVVAFAMQTALVKNIEYGLAISAFCVAVFYISLASLLWRRHANSFRLLTETFLSLGVVFGTLAIPFALDGRWTSAAWALEGAAIIWIGVRQQRLLARLFGVLLQLAAGIAFFAAMLEIGHGLYFRPEIVTPWMFANHIFIGAMLIGIAGLFSSYYLYRHRDVLTDFDSGAIYVMLLWGMLWWLGAGHREVIHFLTHKDYPAGILLYITLGVVILHRLAQRLSWTPMRYALLGYLPAVLVMLLISVGVSLDHPFYHYGLYAWPLMFVTQYFLLYQDRKTLSRGILHILHAVTYWYLLIVVCWESAWWVSEWVEGTTWAQVTPLLVPVLISFILFNYARKIRWPFAVHYSWYAVTASLPVMVLLGITATLYAIMHDGDPWPLQTYIPVLNPLDLSVLFCVMVLVRWVNELKLPGSNNKIVIPMSVWFSSIGVIAFVWLNGMVARSIHHWLGISYNMSALGNSVVFQTSITILWTVTALTLTIVANRMSRRVLWFVGVGLLAAVVIKLFLVDLANRGTLVGILSFIAAAILILLIAYFSPLPPRQQEK